MRSRTIRRSALGTQTASRVRAAVSVALTVCLPLVASVLGGSAPAYADEGQFEALYQEFYTPPDPLPLGSPGDLIRSEPSRLVLEPSGQLGAFVAKGTRIMYRSTDTHGNPVAVTGTYFEPDNPWPGTGPRPLIALATLPYGLGEQCAPSRMFNQGIHASVGHSGFDLMVNLEETFVATMVARGFAIVVTDYEGSGIPGKIQPFLNRVSQGHVLIDAARAAMKLPATSLDPNGPVAFWGYSQGGSASASAAELAASYAPDMRVVGAWVGAPFADLSIVLPFLDGSILNGALGLLLNGIAAAYPQTAEPLMGTLSDRGKDLVQRTQVMCTVEVMASFGFRHVAPYFNTDPVALMSSEPLKGILDAQRIGTLRPSMPVFIDVNRYDPFSPWTGAHQLAVDWCSKGADVEFWTNEQPPFLNKTFTNHFLTYWVDGERSMQWVADRFNGLPTTPNCGLI
ncbi:lipase family protein [Mycolicibacterium holsaticum]|uniref:Triacylglycerol lipase n=1 Tax=Mycolicibacterium holsaticum TaxID=152142 RepID=A0A1E3RY81_9MYCO|nr:lipase family protein [Mycolicibacterium holsaticum]ODQ94317.1 triacylglycerol lipase [Mycolicibacterium holsaticum]